jgi:hypothetical protein
MILFREADLLLSRGNRYEAKDVVNVKTEAGEPKAMTQDQDVASKTLPSWRMRVLLVTKARMK